MANYIGYFLESGSQIVALAAVAVVWLGFAAIGAAAGGRTRFREVDHLTGWALVSGLFTLGGVFLKLPFTPLAIFVALMAVGAGIYAWRRDRAFPVPGIGRMLVLGLPLLVMVSAMRGSQWDEFTDWLVIPRYLLETDAFPGHANAFTKATFAAYPYNWHFVGYLASRLGGGLLESAGALSNVLLLFAFGLLVVRLIQTGAGRQPEGERAGWALTALAMLLVTLVNPTFVQKIVLTAYAETASAVATASAMVLAWMMLDALATREYDRAQTLAWSFGLVLALLVNLKQATLVLVVLVLVAAAMVAVRDRAVPVGRFLKLVPAMILPAVVIYLAWRYHVATELKTGEMSVRPFAEWNIDLIPRILYKMLTVYAKKGYYTVVVVTVLVFGLRGLWLARTSFDRLAALAALIVLGYNAFLLFAYVTTFGKFDAMRAASFWRYSMHLGGVVMAVAAYGGALLWRQRHAGRFRPGRWAWLPVVLIVAAPFVFAPKLRFDREPETRHFRDVGAAVAVLARSEDRIYNVDPTGSGESSAALTFELGERARYAGNISAFTSEAVEAFRGVVAQQAVNALVVHSLLPGVAALIGLELDPNRSYFLRRADGQWRVVASWPKPKGAN